MFGVHVSRECLFNFEVNLEEITMTYNEFIENILDTRGRFACGDEYHERHHIIPECCGGTDDKDNLIDLYAREHFEAHRLLAIENPDNEGLTCAWFRMSFGKNQDRITHIVTPEEYEEAKVAFAQIHSQRMTGENNPMYGKNHSQETRNKISAGRIGKYAGENNPNYGKPLSEEQKQRLSKKAKERFQNPANHPMYGKHLTEDAKRKIGESKNGRYCGENHPMYGKHYSEEVKKRMSESHKGQVPYNKGKSMSEVQKKKLSEAKNGKYSGKDSPRARKVIRLSDCKIYDCGRFAAKDNNMSPSNMCNRCKQHNGFMYYDEYLITQQNDYKEE